MDELLQANEAPQIDAATQIQQFQEFLKTNYEAELLERVRTKKDNLEIDFELLAKFNPDLATLLLEEPENTIKAAEIAVEKLEKAKDFVLRFHNLPSTQYITIRDIRSKHLGKFICTRGIVRQKSDVRPQVTAARFECPSCGNVIAVLQVDTKFREPDRCGCGRKGKFRLLSQELVDAQKIVLEEAPDELEGGEQPKRMNMFLRKDLVSPITDKRTNPGSKILVTGYVKEVPIVLQSGGKSTRYDLMIESNYVEPTEEDYTQINIDPEEEDEIKKIAADPQVFEKLTKSLAPSIYGHDRIKEAIVLQLLGGVKKSRSDGVKSRGDMHILLVGDPGSGKSALIKRCQQVAPKSRFVSGKGASGAGLCVAPGSTVLTNPGGMQAIEHVVEDRLSVKEEFRPGVWKQEDITDVKIQSMSNDLKLHSKHPQAIWKLQAPKQIIEVQTTSGKKIEITANTQLFVLENGVPKWKKSSQVKEGDYIATPRKLIGGNISKQHVVDLITANPVVHDIKPFVKKIVKKLQKKYGTIRKAAKALEVSEGNLYYNWVNEKARGNIKLQDLKKLCQETNTKYKHKIQTVSLYNGKKHKLPTYVSKQFLYVAGLIAGDGDIRCNNTTISIRLSNANKDHLESFKNLITSEFGLSYDIQPASSTRPAAIRCASKLFGQILLALGLCISPKSSKVSMSNTLLHVSNELLAHYLAGLYDADGCVYVRDKGKGSSCIDLTTCSEQLAKQVQLSLLRYEIHAKIRKRPASKNEKVVGKLPKYVIEIRDTAGFKKFYKHFKLQNKVKAAKLKTLAQTAKKEATNKDVLPGVGEALKKVLQQKNIPLKKVGWHPNLSRKALQQVIEKAGLQNKEFTDLAHSDIFWEKVTHTTIKNTTYEYVYDLTVEDSHNFVVDGVLVHNTASVVRDEFLKGWALEAGALVLSHKGYCFIDELDKMSHEDRSAFHEALEQQQITISKANIQATLSCETVVLAAANPKFSRFDPYELLAKQIDLPASLINRFDLIFPVRDLPSPEKDNKMAAFILQLHTTGDVEEVPYETDILRKFFSYAKARCKPRLTEAAIKEIQKFYVDMRNSEGGGEGISAIPISARQLEALVRLSEASAKSRLANEVTVDDAKRAIDLVMYCLKQLGVDPDTGKIDIDRLTTGVTASSRNQIHMMKEIIRELAEMLGNPLVPEEEIIEKAKGKGIDEDKADEILAKLNRLGDIFRPKPGFYSIMK